MAEATKRPTGAELLARLADAALHHTGEKWPEWHTVPLNQWLLIPLGQQTGDHCSFCDGFPLPGDQSPPTVEHWQPRNGPHGKPDKRFEWANLFLCCTACQKAKGPKWDPLLLKPDSEDYSFEKYFECEFTTGKIIPKSDASDHDKERARKTIEIYGLDGRAGMRLQLAGDWPNLKSWVDIDMRSHRYWLLALREADAQMVKVCTPAELLDAD
ncbi:MAG: hypothetical protein V4675_09950 [Verrucomicrobiota bacterium]